MHPVLLLLLFSKNVEMLQETVRAFGNFSRDAGFRQDMAVARGIAALETCANECMTAICLARSG